MNQRPIKTTSADTTPTAMSPTAMSPTSLSPKSLAGDSLPPLHRRPFLRRVAGAAAVVATGVLPSGILSADETSTKTLTPRSPLVRSGPPRLKTSLAAYSFRDFFATKKGKPQEVPGGKAPITMVDFLDYCVTQDYDAAELTSYFFPPDSDDAYYRSLKRAAFLRGVAVSGTAIGNSFTGPPEKLEPEIAKAIDSIAMASSLGAPHIRFFAGSGDQLRKNPERIGSVCDAVLKCADVAEKAGVFLGIENHGNLTSQQMMELMSRLDHPWVGVNLDTGNFFSQSPYDDIQKCLPYTVNIQVKVMMQDANRKKYPADLDRIGKLIRDSGYQGYVVLEYEEDDPYDGVPRATERLRQSLGV